VTHVTRSTSALATSPGAGEEPDSPSSAGTGHWTEPLKERDDHGVNTCSFCGKSEYQVGLYGGPQVAICTECVALFYEDVGPVAPTTRPALDGELIVSVSETVTADRVRGPDEDT
jgi:hypothetical protein